MSSKYETRRKLFVIYDKNEGLAYIIQRLPTSQEKDIPVLKW